MKKSLIMYGAFDRYNYGDNLMPIVLTAFLKKYYPDVLVDYQIETASLFRSNLSSYGCFPTTPIRKFFGKLSAGSIVVIVGGETLSSKAIILFSHHVKSPAIYRIVMRCSRARSTISSFIGVFLCRTGFEYPFTPPTHVFGEHTKIAYNSIGGSFPRQERERSVILSRLKTATFHSVRDSRGADFPNETNRQTRVAPDSVSAIADLFDSDFIFKNVSLSIQKFQRRGYFVFQASPHKSQASASAVAKVLAEASLSSGRPFVLLPIGYAAGHDDRKFLSEIAKISGFEVLEELTIWEILFVIKCSDGFFGTSLHGIITAMAYSVPHFAIGNVEKLRSYLETWGQSPFNGMHNVADIPYLTSLAAQDHSELLSFLASRARSGALENMHNLIRCVK